MSSMTNKTKFGRGAPSRGFTRGAGGSSGSISSGVKVTLPMVVRK
jgi:hypothetical protein